MPKKNKGRAADGLLGQLTPAQRAQYEQFLLSQTQSNEDPPVFWGYHNDVDPTTSDPLLGRVGVESMTPFNVPASDALGEFDRWSQAKIRNFINEAVRSGLLPRDADYFQAKELWKALVSESVDRTAQGERMSPWDVMSFIGGDSGLAQKEDKPKPHTDVTHDKQITLTDPTTARAAVHDMLSQKYGRRATEEELDDFVTSLHTFERSHPATQTTTTRYGVKDGQEVRLGSKTVTHQAGDPTDMMEEKAMETPEYASYQAAGIYFPLLEQLADSIGGG